MLSCARCGFRIGPQRDTGGNGRGWVEQLDPVLSMRILAFY